MSVEVCTDLSGKGSHRKVGMGIVVTSGSLCCLMLITLAWKARDVGLVLALGTIFSIFITPTTLVAVAMTLYKLCAA